MASLLAFYIVLSGLGGFNVAVGGGLGFTHNNQKTHPRLADVIGFCKPTDAPLGQRCGTYIGLY